jgi:hypothetical protein
MKRTTLACAAALIGCGCYLLSISSSQGADKPSGQVKFWKEVSDPAQVLAATFLGGKGHEWLASGGFQPDGTIVLVGNVIGPVMDLSPAAKVIGTDLPPPPAPQRVPVMDRGMQKTDKEGKPVWEKPSWRHDGVTGLIVHCSSDLKRVLAVHRLPWASGALTIAAVGKDGAIYVAGRATDNIGQLGGDVQELSFTAAKDAKDAKCRHTFVAKLSSDGSRAEWVRHVQGPSDAPQLDLAADGKVRFIA